MKRRSFLSVGWFRRLLSPSTVRPFCDVCQDRGVSVHAISRITLNGKPTHLCGRCVSAMHSLTEKGVLGVNVILGNRRWQDALKAFGIKETKHET